MSVGIVVLVVLIVVFAIGFIRPQTSRQVQEKIKDATAKLICNARELGGKAGDETEQAVAKGGSATEEAAYAGRRAHDELFDSEKGAAQDAHLEQRHRPGAERGDEPAEDTDDERR